MGLALDAARGGRLVFQPSVRDSTAAAFADPVRTVAQALERPLDLLPVLVQQVDEKVARLPVGQRLGQVGLLRDPGDDAADDVVQRPVEARLLAALRPGARAASDQLRASPVERRLPFSESPLLIPPSKLITGLGVVWIPRAKRVHRQAYPLPHN